MSITTPPPEIVEEPEKPHYTADRHSILEQQAALNFAQLVSQEGVPDNAQILIDALIVSLTPKTVDVSITSTLTTMLI